MMVPTHQYRFKNHPSRARLFGRRCRVVARGSMNSALVVFEDGEVHIVSRNAVRRSKSDA